MKSDGQGKQNIKIFRISLKYNLALGKLKNFKLVILENS